MKLPIFIILSLMTCTVFAQEKKTDTAIKTHNIVDLLNGKVAGSNTIGPLHSRGHVPIGGPNCAVCIANSLGKIYTYNASIYIFKVDNYYFKLTSKQAIATSILDKNKIHLMLSKEEIEDANCSMGEKSTCCFFAVSKDKTQLKDRLLKEFDKHNIKAISKEKAMEIENSVF